MTSFLQFFAVGLVFWAISFYGELVMVMVFPKMEKKPDRTGLKALGPNNKTIVWALSSFFGFFDYFLLDSKTMMPILKSLRPANHEGKRPK